MLRLFAVAALAFSTLSGLAQKKPLTLKDFNDWKSIRNRSVRDDGKYMMWRTIPQEGNAVLHVYNTQSGETSIMNRASGAQWAPDGQTLLFKVVPDYEEERALKRKKTKKDKMPKDHLVIWNLENGANDTIKNIQSFSIPKEEGNWVAVIFKKEPKTEEPTDSTAAEMEKPVEKKEEKEEPKKEKGKDKKKKKAKKAKGKFVKLINLENREEAEIKFVSKSYWPEYANTFYYLREEGDSIHPKGMYAFNLADQTTTLIDSAFKALNGVSMNRRGTRLAYLTTGDSAKADIRFYTLKLWDGSQSRTILDTATTGMAGMMPAPDFKTVIDENNNYLLVGIKPIPKIYPKDTMALEDEQVKLDIWHWQDQEIQPYQNKNLESARKKAFVQVIDLEDTTFHRYSDERFEVGSYNRDTVQRYAAMKNDWAYKREMSWLLPNHRDMYILDWKTGEKILVAKHERSGFNFSPNQKYAVYWSRPNQHWMAFDVESRTTINLTEFIRYSMADEEWDTPDDPRPYSRVGWIGDSVFVFTDRYDIWGVNPAKPENPVCFTNEMGRENEVVYDYINLDDKAKYLPEQWLLKTFNEKNKDEGLVRLNWQTGQMATLVKPEPMSYGYFTKAKDADVITFTKGNYNMYPELWTTNATFENPEKLSNTNPQQEDYKWGTVALVEWKGYNKKKLQGLLYKPENFDPEKKYPMLVYFYETYSDRLHSYKTPAPSASTINIPYYVSHDYLVFVPDIVYETGEPGQGAFDCVVSGTKHLMKNNWVDEENIAIQGQSWGGYQVAYLVTQTDLYKCAMAGAPVSNMTSAYGGIRWGSGMSREFQYERTQSRLGTTLWEDEDVYIENSPLFYADKVETPLLMMHNDNDGAVPWYQGIEYFMALRRLNKPVWMLVYNGEAHNLRKRHNRKDLSIRMAQFFDHYLKGEPAPEWMVKGRKAVEKETNPATELLDINH